MGLTSLLSSVLFKCYKNVVKHLKFCLHMSRPLVKKSAIYVNFKAMLLNDNSYMKENFSIVYGWTQNCNRSTILLKFSVNR